MSANVNQVEDATIQHTAAVTHTSNSLVASEVKVVASGKSASGGEASSATTISSMSDLKTKAPKLYNAMVEGIAMEICNEMQHAQNRLKAMMRKSTQGG